MAIKSEQMETDENDDKSKIEIKTEEKENEAKESKMREEKEDVKRDADTKENDKTPSQSSKSIHSFFGKKNFFRLNDLW